MSLMPKRVRWRKQQRGSIKGNATKGHFVAYGDAGLQSLEPAWITAAQIEAARVAATRALAGTGRLYIRIFPHKPVTSLPEETRMGKGKGDISYWAAVVKPGTILFEIGGAEENIARKAFNRMSHKLPVKVKMIRRKEAL
ncbi:MAG: 50S ribosomal protein L16 [Planctomycetota bacterium]|nr:50S ribosomal protein L16 [Planctomycetota bacterium]